nr:hypothetical protein [Caviibacterium pharyngocola]
MVKMFKQAPLPFIGQKRMFLNQFKQVLNDNISGDGEGWTIIDAFGGSGLLSHTAKRLKPKARVIYNDFDGYAERLTHINDINRLRRLIFSLLDNCTKNKRIPANVKNQVVDVIKNFDGYINLHILCSWLCFSGKQIKTLDELFRQDFWQCIYRKDVDDVINLIKPWLDDMLRGEQRAIFEDKYACRIGEQNGKMIEFIIARIDDDFFNSTDLVRFVVCRHSVTKQRAWDLVSGQGNPPQVPFCAVQLMTNNVVIDDLAVMPMFGDFERCIAWTWLDSKTI